MRPVNCRRWRGLSPISQHASMPRKSSKTVRSISGPWSKMDWITFHCWQKMAPCSGKARPQPARSITRPISLWAATFLSLCTRMTLNGLASYTRSSYRSRAAVRVESFACVIPAARGGGWRPSSRICWMNPASTHLSSTIVMWRNAGWQKKPCSRVSSNTRIWSKPRTTWSGRLIQKDDSRSWTALPNRSTATSQKNYWVVHFLTCLILNIIS